MNASLTEAQSYSREARSAEELANRLESQASFFKGNSAAGSLNLSQAYREWGLAEIERNRDFYGNVRFDDVTFQLSPEGQALQAKFIEGYAEQLRDGIEDRLVLPPESPYPVQLSLAPDQYARARRLAEAVPAQCPKWAPAISMMRYKGLRLMVARRSADPGDASTRSLRERRAQVRRPPMTSKSGRRQPLRRSQ
jgi:conjugal transfer mating pair stabilization protein TraG